MKRIPSLVLCVIAALVACVSVAGGQFSEWDNAHYRGSKAYLTDSLGGRIGVFTGMVEAKNGLGMTVLNTSTTDTLEVGDVVCIDTLPVTIVARVEVGDTSLFVTVADSILSMVIGWDTFPVPREYRTGPVYKQSQIGVWQIRVWHYSASETACTTSVRVSGRDAYGVLMSKTVRWYSRSGAVDSVIDLFSHIDSVYVTGAAATDSFGIYAHPQFGVKTKALGSDRYTPLVTVSNRILPRKTGYAAFSGLARVRVTGASTAIQPGDYLAPSGTARYAAASKTMPLVQLGTALNYAECDTLIWAHLSSPGGTSGSETTAADLSGIRDTLEMARDTARAGLAAANTAQDTANAALTAAGVAQDTANAALTAAGTAQDTANEALADAEVANDTATAALDAAREKHFFFTADELTLPTSGGGELVKVDGTNLSYDAVVFDSAASETAFVSFPIGRTPHADVATSCTLSLYWLTDSSGEGDVLWEVQDLVSGSGESFDSAFTAPAYTADTTVGANKMNVANIIKTVDWADEDMVTLRIVRNPAEGQDTFTDEAKLVAIAVKW